MIDLSKDPHAYTATIRTLSEVEGPLVQVHNPARSHRPFLTSVVFPPPRLA